MVRPLTEDEGTSLTDEGPVSLPTNSNVRERVPNSREGAPEINEPTKSDQCPGTGVYMVHGVASVKKLYCLTKYVKYENFAKEIALFYL